MFPGVLILEKNRTFGKIKNKYLYKCIPHNRDLQPRLVAYLMKNVGFNKHYKNKYIIFVDTDRESNGHTIATIKETIGDVDVLENFYQYSLHCKQIYPTMSAFNKAVKIFRNKEEELIGSLLQKCKNHRMDETVISIDPNGSVDIDDAFSFEVVKQGKSRA